MRLRIQLHAAGRQDQDRKTHLRPYIPAARFSDHTSEKYFQLLLTARFNPEFVIHTDPFS
jgi:hypothetical protein